MDADVLCEPESIIVVDINGNALGKKIIISLSCNLLEFLGFFFIFKFNEGKRRLFYNYI